MVIPREAREKLGVHAGDLVVSYVEGGKLVTVPIRKVKDPLRSLIVTDKPMHVDVVRLIHEAREE